MSELTDIKLISGSAHPLLGREIAACLRLEISGSKTKRFADGETRVQIADNLRNSDIYVIQSTCPPVNDNLMELYITVDALRRASAKSINVVLPYAGYLRQDKKVKPREPITAKMFARFLETVGADRVMMVDPHFEQVQGFFEVPVDVLYGGPVIAQYLLNKGLSKDTDVVVSPDTSGTTRAKYLAAHLGLDFIVIDKDRHEANEIKSVRVIGDARGKRCFMIDDMLDTANSALKGVDALYAQGATEVYIAVSHALMSGEAASRLKASPVTEVVCLNTLPPSDAKQMDKVTTLSVAPLIGEAIRRHHTGESISNIFNGYRN